MIWGVILYDIVRMHSNTYIYMPCFVSLHCCAFSQYHKVLHPKSNITISKRQEKKIEELINNNPASKATLEGYLNSLENKAQDRRVGVPTLSNLTHNEAKKAIKLMEDYRTGVSRQQARQNLINALKKIRRDGQYAHELLLCRYTISIRALVPELFRTNLDFLMRCSARMLNTQAFNILIVSRCYGEFVKISDSLMSVTLDGLLGKLHSALQTFAEDVQDIIEENEALTVEDKIP